MGNSSLKSAKLTVNGKTLDLPFLVGTENEQGLDIARLRSGSGAITLDPGYGNTGSCTSAITFLDGEKGILRYRGYPIQELAEAAAYTEVAYLLIHGELPNKQQLEKFNQQIRSRMIPQKGIEKLFEALPQGIHPMAALSAVTQALSAYYPELAQPNLTKEQMDEAIVTLLAQVPILAGLGYRREKGLPPVAPRNDLSYTGNTLNLWFGGQGGKEPTDVAVKAFRAILILHADHEQNCSTSTVRMVGSSRASAFTSISAGMGALWGPLHGGANQAVLEMLEQIQKSGGDMQKTIAMAKDKSSGFRLMGFGHRVYKNFDPRSRILMAACGKVLKEIGVNDPLLELAKKLEAAALKDDYFLSRKLYPNVDFYSGIILRALGIPTRQFTVIFALGRLSGWLAHWKEMLLSPDFRIGRPRQIYTGPAQRVFVPLSKRN